MMTIKDISLSILAIVLIGILIYLALLIRTETRACLDHPIPYGIYQLDKSNNAQTSCTCFIAKEQGQSVIVRANSSGFSPLVQTDFSGQNRLNFDFAGQS